MKLQYITSLALTYCLLSCGDKGGEKQEEIMQNPFLVESYATPFEVPPFHLIENEHYMPAFEKAFAKHKAEIQVLVAQKEAPSFENTIVALDNAGKLLTRVSRVFYNLNSANTNDEMQAAAQELAPKMAAHSDEISLNPKLFARVEAVWEARESLNLNPEQSKLLEKTYKGFIRSGAKVEDKERLMAINAKLSSLTVQFGQNILAETNNYKLIINKEEELTGLPASLIASAAKAAGKEGTWSFGLSNAQVMPFLKYADNRARRKEIWEAYTQRAAHGNDKDNEEIIRELVALRAEKAQLLGYENHADFVLEERMAKNIETVYELLNQLWSPALLAAQKEEAALSKLAQTQGMSEPIAPYDWRYYEEKLRKERFSLDEQELMPYFSLEAVRSGIFDLCEKLYGLKFVERPELPVYHEEVQAFEVLEANGSHVGILYMDMHPRAAKRGGAWMTSFRAQTREGGKRKAPVISIVCNFSPASDDAPSLLTFDELTTFFHEFGHALHGLLSDVQYSSLAGTSVPTDFVELPSQLMENWAAEPAFLKTYAKHYKTGEPIPDALIEKLQAAATFGQGFATVEYLASTFLDLDYHSRKESFLGSIPDFEANAMKKIGLIASIVPRHRSSYFGHIFAGGYSAGYYSYIWSGVLDTDAYQAFKETELFNPAKAQAFRKEILERGGSADPMDMYVAFRGAKPSINALLKKRGLLPQG